MIRLPNLKLSLIFLLALLLLTPTLSVIYTAFMPAKGSLSHLINTTLPRYSINAILMLIGVLAISFILGVIPAWLVSMYKFPLAKYLRFTMILPLAIPAYILAIIYGRLLDPAGVVQSWIREVTGLKYGEYYFFEIRSIYGVILLLSLSLYPYIYIFARNSFAKHSNHLLDSARMLGISQAGLLTKIAIPVARPAIAVAMALVGMEVLADFGTVSLFGVESFTTAIYKSWYGMGDIATAARLAAMLLAVIAIILWFERYSRRNARFHNEKALYTPLTLQEITGCKKYLATIFCLTPVILGFVLPIVTLAIWSLKNQASWLDSYNWQALGNSIIIAVAVVLSLLTIALIFAFTMRQNPRNKLIKTAIRLASTGYAIPGSVIAIGVIIPVIWFDQQIHSVMQSWGITTGLVLSGSIFAIVFACSVRFLTIALGSIESALQSVSPAIDDSAKCLGISQGQARLKIHLPIIKNSVAVAGVMVFVDTIKELPATILLRPFNFDSLAIRTFELASDEQIIASATPALMMVTIAFIPIIFVYKYMENMESGV